ncbi:YeiH family protein [Roseomonas populi]|uniref:Sulfate exporter family transporter n=1 Tax=Roseomonas populi TaxID=3121582 RepID=A0ABT1XBN0_9PROT|nr:putative sulfate exporter family transporter [Roseomonas pecuniae]MCR0984527.1 putative sulfate exporter family transporter [Roseomonas pecuniae]
MTLPDRVARLLPGVTLCSTVSLAALGLARIEEAAFGRAWLETLVLAILLGVAIRTAWRPGARWKPGIDFSAKMLLEVAVVLLGASLSAATILAVGWELLLGIAVVVVVAILASYALGRAFGLSPRLAVLVACGNSICGNSAIAAVAPVVGAEGEDVAASIAFTAVLGVGVVLALPLLAPLLGLSAGQYGVLAGLTVYAVPQVLAATAPIGVLSVQVGTLVKLVRVLMLGPVVLALSLVAPRQGGARPPLSRLVPWFILGFLGLAALRSLGLVPAALLGPMAAAATALTVLAMAALGLGVDVRMVARSGGRVVGAAVASLLLLGAVSLGLIRALGVA